MALHISKGSLRDRGRAAITLIGLTSVVASLVACSSAAAPGEPGSADPIVIGMSQALTGDFVAVGSAIRDGAEYAVDEINADGGLLGREVKLVVRDDQSKPEQAVSAFNELAGEVSVYVAPGTAASAIALLDLAERRQIPLVSPGTGESMTEPLRTNVFQVPSTGVSAGEAMAQYLVESGYERVFGIVNTDDESLPRSWAAIESILDESGNPAVGSAEVSFATADHSSVIAQARAADADAIAMLQAAAPAVAFAQQVADGFPEATVVASNAVAADYYVKDGGEYVNGNYVLTILAGIADDLPESSLKTRITELRDGYTEASGVAPDQFTVNGYATFEVIFAAIEKAGSTEPEAIQEALSDLSTDTVLGPIGYSDDNHGGPDSDYIAMAKVVDNALVAEPSSIDRLNSLLN